MSWFDKILQRQSTPDDSRDLKNGEVKELLVNSFKIILPDFDFSTYKNSTYFFQRKRTFRGYELHESLNIIFSLKEKMFSCSVASVLNKSYLFSSTYNSGFLIGHGDLLAIKSGSGKSKIEDSYYWHNGKIATVDKVIKQIAEDYRKFGFQYLDTRLKRMETSDLVAQGLDFIEKLSIDKDRLKQEIEIELKNEEHVVSRIKHLLFVQLRDTLQNVPGQSREDRQEISRLTFELLELYYER